MKQPTVLVAACVFIMLSIGLTAATFSTDLELYSGGVYNFDTHYRGSGNVEYQSATMGDTWGFFSDSFAKGYNCGKNQDFEFTMWQNLQVNKIPLEPTDPSWYGWINAKDGSPGSGTVEANLGATYTGVPGASSAGFWGGIEASKKVDLIRWRSYGNNAPNGLWGYDLTGNVVDHNKKFTMNFESGYNGISDPEAPPYLKYEISLGNMKS